MLADEGLHLRGGKVEGLRSVEVLAADRRLQKAPEPSAVVRSGWEADRVLEFADGGPHLVDDLEALVDRQLPALVRDEQAAAKGTAGPRPFGIDRAAADAEGRAGLAEGRCTTVAPNDRETVTERPGDLRLGERAVLEQRSVAAHPAGAAEVSCARGHGAGQRSGPDGRVIMPSSTVDPHGS